MKTNFRKRFGCVLVGLTCMLFMYIASLLWGTYPRHYVCYAPDVFPDTLFFRETVKSGVRVFLGHPKQTRITDDLDYICYRVEGDKDYFSMRKSEKNDTLYIDGTTITKVHCPHYIVKDLTMLKKSARNYVRYEAYYNRIPRKGVKKRYPKYYDVFTYRPCSELIIRKSKRNWKEEYTNGSGDILQYDIVRNNDTGMYVRDSIPNSRHRISASKFCAPHILKDTMVLYHFEEEDYSYLFLGETEDFSRSSSSDYIEVESLYNYNSYNSATIRFIKAEGNDTLYIDSRTRHFVSEIHCPHYNIKEIDGKNHIEYFMNVPDNKGRHYWEFKYRPYWIMDINIRKANPKISYVVSNEENAACFEQITVQKNGGGKKADEP